MNNGPGAFFVSVLVFLLNSVCGCSSISSSKLAVEPAKRSGPRLTRVWAKNLDEKLVSGNLSIGRGGPFFHRGILYIGDLNGIFHAYDAESGREVWNAKDGKAISGRAVSHDEHILYLTYSGRLHARHYLTGELKFAIDLPAPAHTWPLVYNDRVFVHLRNHQLIALDASTGKILWAYKRSIPYLTTLDRFARPMPYKQSVIVGMADGFLVSFQVDDGQLLWEKRLARTKRFVDVDFVPLLFDGKIYAASSNNPLMVLDAPTGDIVSQYDVFPTHAPVLIGNSLYMGNLKGEVLRLSLDTASVKRVKVAKKGIGSLRYWKNQLIATTYDGRLLSINPVNLDVKVEEFYGHRYSSFFGPIAMTKKFLAVYSARNRLYVYK